MYIINDFMPIFVTEDGSNHYQLAMPAESRYVYYTIVLCQKKIRNHNFVDCLDARVSI